MQRLGSSDPLGITDPLLVVSPHFDDVPLSCEALVARDTAMTVLHVFSRGPEPAMSTDWDTKTGFRDSDEAMATRLQEERAAFDGTSHSFREVGLLDEQYLKSKRADDDLNRIADAVLSWTEEVGGPCTVALPVCAGWPRGSRGPIVRLRRLMSRGFLPFANPDHCAARDGGVRALAGRPELGVLLYEELPYRLSVRGDRSATQVAERFGPGTKLVRRDVPIDTGLKARRLRAYESQLPLLFEPAALKNDHSFARFLPSRERYWRVIRG